MPASVGSIEQLMPASRRSCRRPQRREQVVEKQNGLAGRDANDVAAIIDSPPLAKAGENDVLLLGVDEDIANVLQAGQKDHFLGERLSRLQGVFNGFFQAAERDLAERSGRIEVGMGFLGQPRPLGPEPAKGIDAGIFDESIGLDRDAADRTLVAVVDRLGVRCGWRQHSHCRGAEKYGGKQAQLARNEMAAGSHDGPLLQEDKTENFRKFLELA